MASIPSARPAVALPVPLARLPAVLPFLALLLLAGCVVEERTPEPPAATDPPAAPATPPPAAPPPAAVPGEPSPAPAVPGGPPPILTVGEPFWVGEATRGAELRASFPSPRAADTYLDRGQPAARTPDGRVWELGEILVSVEYPGAGGRVVWRVAGPGEVVDRYLERLREEEAGGRTPLGELGILPMEVRHCCADPPSRQIPPEEEGSSP